MRPVNDERRPAGGVVTSSRPVDQRSLTQRRTAAVRVVAVSTLARVSEIPPDVDGVRVLVPRSVSSTNLEDAADYLRDLPAGLTIQLEGRNLDVCRALSQMIVADPPAIPEMVDAWGMTASDLTAWSARQPSRVGAA